MHRFLLSLFFLSSLGLSAAELPLVALFTTGGTIQSKGAHRLKLAEYSDGRVTPDELLADLPELKSLARIEVTEISNVGSGNITTETLLKLSKSITATLARPEVSGAVDELEPAHRVDAPQLAEVVVAPQDGRPLRIGPRVPRGADQPPRDPAGRPASHHCLSAQPNR